MPEEEQDYYASKSHGRNLRKPKDQVTEFRFKERKGHVPMRDPELEKPEAKHIVGVAVGAIRKTMFMTPVQSNAELCQRLDEYFTMAEAREIPPTVEEMALYCGYSPQAMRNWRDKRTKGFVDTPISGLTTAEISKRAFDMIHAVDAVLAESGKMTPVVYIFRAKNYFGMRDSQEIVVSTENDLLGEAKSPEEIARSLPKPDAALLDADVSGDGVTIS